MNDIAKLMGGPSQLKLLRLFYFNPDMAFTNPECATRTRITNAQARSEINNLLQSRAIKKRSAGAGKFVYSANQKFKHYEALAQFLRDTTDIKDSAIADSLKSTGVVKIVALSGLFTGAQEPQIDILIAGDNLSERKIARVIHTLEAELGRELRYACFTTEDFRYRMGVYDRLIRDMFDYNHRLIVDKIGLS